MTTTATATAQVLPMNVNGVSVDELSKTVDAIKAARPSRNSHFAFATNGWMLPTTGRPWTRCTV